MALPFADGFTAGANTALPSYSADWDVVADNDTHYTVSAATGVLQKSAAGTRFAVCNANTGSVVNYFTRAVVNCGGDTSGNTTKAVTVRSDDDSAGAQDAYFGNVNGNGNYAVGKVVAGSFTTNSSGAIDVITFSADADTTIYMEIDGTGTGTYDFQINSNSQASGTMTGVDGAGNPGVYGGGASGYWDDLSAAALVAASSSQLFSVHLSRMMNNA